MDGKLAHLAARCLAVLDYSDLTSASSVQEFAVEEEGLCTVGGVYSMAVRCQTSWARELNFEQGSKTSGSPYISLATSRVKDHAAVLDRNALGNETPGKGVSLAQNSAETKKIKMQLPRAAQAWVPSWAQLDPQRTCRTCLFCGQRMVH